MLSRKYRATRLDIENTIKAGMNIPGICLYAKISRNDSAKAGFAIVVSKKTEKTSVGRHQIKRKLSACIEASLPQMQSDFKKTVVFFVKDRKNPAFYDQAEKDIQEILTKAHFFN